MNQIINNIKKICEDKQPISNEYLELIANESIFFTNIPFPENKFIKLVHYKINNMDVIFLKSLIKMFGTINS